MATNVLPLMTVERYIEIEERGGVRHEYFAGETFEMEGPSFEHQQILSNHLVSVRPKARRGGRRSGIRKRSLRSCRRRRGIMTGERNSLYTGRFPLWKSM